jgi:hypothetical protein
MEDLASLRLPDGMGRVVQRGFPVAPDLPALLVTRRGHLLAAQCATQYTHVPYSARTSRDRHLVQNAPLTSAYFFN